MILLGGHENGGLFAPGCYMAVTLMELEPKYALMAVGAMGISTTAALDPGASPFKVVVDPQMRLAIRKALFDLIDHHDEALAGYFAQGKLSLESYKEYIELFARSLRETMESREGIEYLLKSAGFDSVPPEDINLTPEWRWREAPAPAAVPSAG
jgi:hypothetical protein